MLYYVYYHGRIWVVIMLREGHTVGYLYALVNYLKTEKARHDIMDYVRAIIIMGAVMAMIRIMLDILHS
jgi:predicted aconitase with swiveling domain